MLVQGGPVRSAYDRNHAGIEIDQEFVKIARTRMTLLGNGQGKFVDLPATRPEGSPGDRG